MVDGLLLPGAGVPEVDALVGPSRGKGSPIGRLGQRVDWPRMPIRCHPGWEGRIPHQALVVKRCRDLLPTGRLGHGPDRSAARAEGLERTACRSICQGQGAIQRACEQACPIRRPSQTQEPCRQPVGALQRARLGVPQAEVMLEGSSEGSPIGGPGECTHRKQRVRRIVDPLGLQRLARGGLPDLEHLPLVEGGDTGTIG